MIQESFVKKIFEMFEMFVAKTAVINCYYILKINIYKKVILLKFLKGLLLQLQLLIAIIFASVRLVL